MKKLLLSVIGLIGILSLSSCDYNGMVKLDEQVRAQWAQVENQYQRRADLIPNLVNTVKGAAKNEQETLTRVVEARAKATSINVDPEKLTPENIQKFQQAQGELSVALGRLLSLQENYPDLKTNQNFLELSAEISGTENRIARERQKFNEVTQTYNSKIRSFPNNLTAGMFGFEKKGYFEAEAGSKQVPKVEF
jgi:LemA protein